MILQALNDLFHRLKDEEGNPYGLPTPGYSVQNVTFRIVLNPDGTLHDIQDGRETLTEPTKSGKTKTKLVPRNTLAPDLGGRSRNTKAYFLCDKLSYLTGFDADSSRAALAKEHFEASKARHTAFREMILSKEYQAICTFFDHFKLSDHLETVTAASKFASTGVGVFRVLPSHKDVHEQAEIVTFWQQYGENLKTEGETCVTGQCLVTGNEAPLARLHEPKMKGFGQDSPLLVSFNDSAYQSYGKDQSYNAPVSQAAVFAYCNALNALLSGPQSHRHRVTIGDTTTIFWTEKKTGAESIFAQLLDGPLEESASPQTIEGQATHRKLDAYLNVLRKGGGASARDIEDNPNTKFFILGLSKVTKSRLAVRFSHVSTLGEMLERLRDHYQNLALYRRENASPFYEPEFPSAQRLLDQSARERKAIPPLLGGQLMQAILHGTRYPMTLCQGVLNRLRANDDLSYLKAAVLKAILTRNFSQTIDMSLNTERTDPAYLLGRLFAALEKTQEDALGKVNAGLRERFYSSASATPGNVFPRILRTYQHHLAKLEGGMKTNRERLVQSIHAPLDAYPAHLNLEEQGLFAIGYYHQRQAFFTKQTQPETSSIATN